MSADSAIASGRAAAERDMLDKCKVEYEGDRTELEAGTAKHVPVMETRVAEARCKLQLRDVDSRSEKQGGAERTHTKAVHHMPWNTDEVFPGDVVTYTEIGPESPPWLLNKSFKILGAVNKSRATAQRFDVEVL